MAKIGISSISIDGANFTPLCSTKEIDLTMKQEETPEWAKIDITKPISISATIRAKKNGTTLEKSLYYQKSKKKRIRKKWSLERILKIGERYV